MSLEGKRIMFVAGTLGMGGAERQLLYILTSLKQAGANIQLLCLTSGEYYEKQIEQLGVSIIYIGKGNKLSRLYQMIRSVKSWKPDVLQSQHFYTNPYVAITGRFCRVLSFGAMRSNCITEVKQTGKILGPLSLRLPKYIISNSHEAISNAIKFGLKKSNLFYLPNAIDISKFEKDPEKAPFSKTTIQILFVGRLVAEKQPFILIETVDSLKKAGYYVHLTIIGDGNLKPGIERLVQEKSLREQITLVGNVSDPERYYSQADIFLYPTAVDGTPNVILEAMASRLPIVTTPVGMIPTLITNEVSGLIVSSNDTNDFVAACIKIITNPGLSNTMSKSAFDHIKLTRGLGMPARVLEEIYNNV